MLKALGAVTVIERIRDVLLEAALAVQLFNCSAVLASEPADDDGATSFPSDARKPFRESPQSGTLIGLT